MAQDNRPARMTAKSLIVAPRAAVPVDGAETISGWARQPRNLDQLLKPFRSRCTSLLVIFERPLCPVAPALDSVQERVQAIQRQYHADAIAEYLERKNEIVG